jgi:hypothetical protein
MRFMAPQGRVRRAWRNLVLRMAPRLDWFRSRVDSGRLAEPARYPSSGPDDAALPRHGSVAPDLPVSDGGRLRDRLGRKFAVIAPRPVEASHPVIVVGPDTVYGDRRAWLVRPDAYLADSVDLDDRGAPGVMSAWSARYMKRLVDRP